MEQERFLKMELTDKEARMIYHQRIWDNKAQYKAMLPGLALFIVAIILLVAGVVNDVGAAIILAVAFILFLWRSRVYQKKVQAEAQAAVEKEIANG